jgi:hypothetical protein
VSFLSVFQNAETQIEAFITKLVSEGETAISEIESALSHAASLIPSIAPEVIAVTTFVEGLGAVAGQPEVAAAAAAMQTAVAGLSQVEQAYTTATTGGGITASAATQTILTGYQAYNQTLAAIKNLKAAATAGAAKPAVVKP